MSNFFGVTGNGPAIVFLHAAMADRRMWHPQWEHFAATNTLVRMDLRGFGDCPPSAESFSNAADVLAVLDDLEIPSAVIIGNSMGARVACEVALMAPDRVNGLVLIGPGLGSHDWSQEVRDFWQVEADALDAGDLDGAVAANLEFWLDGPNRDRANLSSEDRALVAAMQRRAFELELAHPDAAQEIPYQRFDEELATIAVPCRVLYGTEDAADIGRIAKHLAVSIPGASLHAIKDTAHLPSLEAPAECNVLIAEVLAEAG